MKIVLLACFAFIIPAFTLPTPKPSELKKFNISITRSTSRLTMKASQGCSWKSMSFTVKNNVPQAINEFGQTEDGKDIGHDDKLADFFILIFPDSSGITLKGVHGTAWTTLHFSLRNGDTVLFNESGMINTSVGSK